MVRPAWNDQQRERNTYVRFRTAFMFDRFVRLAPDGAHRILDFGCGEGHSVEVLLERYPNASFVAADIYSPRLDEFRARFGTDPRVTMILMDGPRSLAALGTGFDIIQLNAVFEHLLPDERQPVMSDLWRRLVPDGYMVITETPWRWFPIETHSTSLPLVNYLPDRLALWAARHCGRFPVDQSWDEALREGLRGGTVAEIIACLGADSGGFRLVESAAPDARNLLDTWWHGECRQTRAKAFAYRTLDWCRRLSGVTISPWINLVLQKTR
jgi:SAM-dependent methyltransferase